MSGFGGFGGFGQNNQQNASSGGFGGFGSTNNNTTGGFGTSNTGTGFGNSGGSVFGNNSNNNNSSSTGFGGFGTSNNAFGQNKTGFGTTATTSSGSLFGGSTAATSGTGFGGFGGGATGTSTGFGTSSGGGMFGSQNKPSGFGTTATTGGGGLFGGSGTSGFGSSATTGTGFGAGGTSFSSSSQQNNGTGTVPFAETTEKDSAASGNQLNKFQSVSTMEAYKNFSFEELRLVDYAQGRKQGNANGQAGAFGASSGFGGFGTTAGTTPATGGFGSSATGTTGGLFGSTPSTGFSQQNTATTGFGSSTTGGLFGAKPATTGGLFGSTATSGQSGGGLFGTSGNTNTGFGSTGGFGANNTSSATTGGLFGNAPAKPAFGGFGSTGTGTGFGASTGGGFGSGTSTSAAGGGLFGNNATTATTGFGNQPASSGFSFGQNNQANNQPAQTGGLFGNSSGFGQNNQQKPGGLFGSSTPAQNTGGGLFGQSQPAQTGGLFGNVNQTQQSGGLFGAKPAATSGLFGNSTGGTTGGLFGNSNQQGGTSSLFGQSNNQQTAGPFGSKPATTGLGSSLFGNSQQNAQPAQGNSLFGNSQQTQGGLFGNSQVPQQAPQQPGSLNASLLQNPYGNDALFANIGTPTQSVGPIATPLSNNKQSKKQALIPAYKISPAASSRLTTPQKRPAGYGFSYSTYGTPGSAIAASPFGFSTMLSPPYGRSLNKSMSTSNLRHAYSAEDSILNPAAFTSTVRGGTGRLKKLNVDKSLNAMRKPLFGIAAPEPRKSVSFDTSSINGVKSTNGTSNADNPTMSGALVRTESPTSDSEVNGNVPQKSINGSRGKELAIVPEDYSPEPSTASRSAVQVPRSHADQAVGAYWSKPTLAELHKMPREELSNLANFEVGCEGQGKIEFSKVDLTGVPLEKIFGDIVLFETRKVTVYGDRSTVLKPPVGHGLNVPSTITLENSWPRANAGATPVLEHKGKRIEKHIQRLKRLPNTEFITYDTNNGTWVFKVGHYTTYGLPEEDEEYDESNMESSILEGLGTPTPSRLSSKAHGHLSSPPINSDSSLPSPPESSPDDTFDFKKGKKKRLLPGQFDDEDGMEMDEEADDEAGSLQSFLEQRSVGSSVDDTEYASELGMAEDQEMAGSFPKPTRTTEPSTALTMQESILTKPKPILKGMTTFGTPTKTGTVLFGNDWTEQLQWTVSPRKQDRVTLRANQSVTFKAPDNETTAKASDVAQPFATSMDIMNSLFNQSARTAPTAKFGVSAQSYEFPNKRTKFHDKEATQALNDAFHNTTKPSWGPHGTFVYTAAPLAPSLQRNGIVERFGASIVGEHNDVRFAKLSGSSKAIPPTITEQQTCTDISFIGKIPQATTNQDFDFAQFAETVSLDTAAGRMEQRAWELAHILFDKNIETRDVVSQHDKELYELRLRKDKVSEFWKKLVRSDVQTHVARAASLEEKAFAYLTGGMIEDASNVLVEGKNFHLATLVAQIGCDQTFKQAITTQLESWRSLNIFSEFEDPIRAIYELLAGNTCNSKGRKTAGIEDQVEDLNFATRFQLDWRRSFGLRLWYGIAIDQDISEAVLQYRQDLTDGLEQVKPVPWFVEQNLSVGWTDDKADSREDLVWSLLQLDAGDSTDLTAAFTPECVSGNPLDARLSFQLINLFRAQNIGLDDEINDSLATADALASTYAADLATSIPSNPAALVSACWVLLHLSDANARRVSICSLLDQHAALIDVPEGSIYTDLLNLRIPRKWIYLSKALYARAVQRDAVLEAQALIEADEWEQAHEVVCRTVGPLAVIETDADQLRELLGGLHEPVEKGNRYHAVWEKGAGIYYNFVEMRDLERQRGQKWKELVAKLNVAMEGLNRDGGMKGKELLERAALQIIGSTVANYAAEGEIVDRAESLKVPLTEDGYLRHSRALGMEYFKALMAA